MKRKILNVLFALVLVFSFSLVIAAPGTPALATAPATLNVYPFSLYADEDYGTAVWSTAQHHTGSSSVLLTHDATNTGSDYVQFVPETGVTLADLGAADGTPDWSWWHYTPATLNNWSQIELRFTQPGGDADIALEVTAMPLQNFTGAGAWAKQSLVQATSGLLYYGTDAAGHAYSWTTGGDSALKTVAGIVAAIKANTTGTDSDAVLDALVLTRVRVELWEASNRACYIDDITIAGTMYYGLIGDAVSASTAGDTINVTAGTYTADTFPIAISKALTIQSAAGAATTIINSGTGGQVLNITAAGVTIGGSGAGFTIEGGSVSANGVIHVSTNTMLSGNTIVTDYYGVVTAPGATGLSITDNTFLAFATVTSDQTTGIYVDASNSTFDGNSFPLGDSDTTQFVDSGITVVNGADLTIENNTFEGIGTRVFEDSSMGCGAIEFYDASLGAVTINNNTIENCNDGIYFSSDVVLDGSVLVDFNTITGNTWGVEFKGVDDDGFTIQYNDITNNSEYGVLNDGDGTIYAQYNWWGDVSGPAYNVTDITGNDRGVGDAISGGVNYEPWLTVSQATAYGTGIAYYGYNLCVLVPGWNIWSTPIALDTHCDTWSEYKALGIDLDLAEGANAYYFNGTTQLWASVTDAYALTPSDAIYINMASAQTSPILFSTGFSVPTKALKVGWNLVSASFFDDISAPDISDGVAPETALASAYYVTGDNIIGYSQVVSPAAGNQLPWSSVRGPAIDTATSKTMYPTKGYWVFMVNPGTLAGTVFTPVSTESPS